MEWKTTTDGPGLYWVSKRDKTGSNKFSAPYLATVFGQEYCKGFEPDDLVYHVTTYYMEFRFIKIIGTPETPTV